MINFLSLRRKLSVLDLIKLTTNLTINLTTTDLGISIKSINLAINYGDSWEFAGVKKAKERFRFNQKDQIPEKGLHVSIENFWETFMGFAKKVWMNMVTSRI